MQSKSTVETLIKAAVSNMLDVPADKLEGAYDLYSTAVATELAKTQDEKKRAIFDALQGALEAEKAIRSSPLAKRIKAWAGDGDDPFGVNDYTDSTAAIPKRWDMPDGGPALKPEDFFTTAELNACGLGGPGAENLRIPRGSKRAPIDRLCRGPAK